MNAAIDHVFVCCSVGAEAEADALARLGLREGTPNTHPGQGTSCRDARAPADARLVARQLP